LSRLAYTAKAVSLAYMPVRKHQSHIAAAVLIPSLHRCDSKRRLPASPSSVYSIHTIRVHGPCSWPVNTAVDMGSVYRA